MDKSRETIIRNLFYSLGAILIFNAALQLIVYPLLNKNLGPEKFGSVLFVLGIVGILAPSFGMGIGNTRLILRNKYETKNGDFNTVLIVSFLLSLVGVALTLILSKDYNFSSFISVSMLTCITILRYYSDVEYRLNINYKKYFIYYMALISGYLVGLVLYYVTNQWILVFICGEMAAVLFVLSDSLIYSKPFSKSINSKLVFKSSIILSMSYLISNLMLNIDRIILLGFVGNLAVTVYYVTSLYGKTLAMIVTPLSNVFISYISGSDKKINRKQFFTITILIIGTGIAFFIAGIAITPLFIKIIYPDLYELAEEIINIVNLAQIMYCLSAFALVVVLTICEYRWQFIIQISYAIIFVLLAIFMTIRMGIYGFAISNVIANSYKLLFTLMIGWQKSNNVDKLQRGDNKK